MGFSCKEFCKRANAGGARAVLLLTDNWILIVGIFLIIILLAIASMWNWDFWSELTFDKSHNVKEIRLDRTKIIQQLLLIVGGFAAFALASWRSWTAHRQAKAALAQVEVALRQANLAERAHNIDRYARAANMLDSDKIAVRQAGVYTLLELGRSDTDNFYNLIIKLLAGFSRVRSAEYDKQERERRRLVGLEREMDETVEFSDLYDAICSIGWLRDQCPDQVEGERTAKFTLNLAGIVGAARDFREVDFSLVNLRSANFIGSYFRLATFWRADLRYATFHGVRAQWSDFSQALFQNTDLELAEFNSCNFSDVSFAVAKFKLTKFSECNISGAQFESASGLASAMLSDAWAWQDDPPNLPNGVNFNNLYDPGPMGSLRKAYEQMQSSRRGFDPPR